MGSTAGCKRPEVRKDVPQPRLGWYSWLYIGAKSGEFEDETFGHKSRALSLGLVM